MGAERYKFKWDNMDLPEYVEHRQAAATILRREAAVLVRRAEQIEEELAELRTTLMVVTDEDPA